MKKLSIILLALAFALAFAVPAMAIHVGSEGTSGGSLGITGTYKIDGEIQDDDNVTEEFFDDDFELVMRYTTGNVLAVVDWELSDRTFAGHSNDITLLDNYWVEWSATDALTLKVGEYALGFGRKVVIYNEGGSNIGVMYGLDAVDLGFQLGKAIEDDNVADGEDADATDYVITANFKEAGPFTKLNLIYVASMVEEANTPTPVRAESDDNYTGVDFALPLGPVALAGEFASLGGDNAEGSFFLVEIGLAELVGFDVGVNMFQSSDDFNPAPFDGGDDYTPFGIFFDEYNEPQIDTTAIWLTFGYDVNDKLSLSAAALVSAENDAGDDLGTEVDVGLSYKIADQVTYDASFSSYSEGDDVAVAAGLIDRTELWHRLTFKF